MDGRCFIYMACSCSFSNRLYLYQCIRWQCLHCVACARRRGLWKVAACAGTAYISRQRILTYRRAESEQVQVPLLPEGLLLQQADLRNGACWMHMGMATCA